MKWNCTLGVLLATSGLSGNLFAGLAVSTDYRRPATPVAIDVSKSASDKEVAAGKEQH